MMQYNDRVQKQRDILKAEKWASNVKFIVGQFKNDLKEWVTTYNNDDKSVEQYKNNQLVDKWVVKGEMSVQDCIDEMSREGADGKYR
tara:strand:- start:926 stop:1186 length:261 start_codon:yes stop_codon:yes gene_type:complete